MNIISENNLCKNRPYINLKKLSSRTSIRKGEPNDAGFKGTYIIDQNKNSLYSSNDYSIEFNNGIEKQTFVTDTLNGMLLVEVNYSNRSGAKSAKFKVYAILNNIKYVLPFAPFEDTYKDCLDIISNEIKDQDELDYVKDSFDNLEKDEIEVDFKLTLERLSEFRDRVNYKRNIDYFVINNLDCATSKYDINSKSTIIEISDTVQVLRYEYSTRSYNILTSRNNSNTIELKETDIICNLGDSKDNNSYPTVSIYMNYGLGKLLDVKNNVIPTSNTISLFANLLDLDLDVL